MNGSHATFDPLNLISRKKKWIQPDIQFRMIFSILLVTFLTLLVNFHVILGGLFIIQRENHMSPNAALEQAQHFLITEFLISLGIAVPLAIWIGVSITFKFCGPVFRFKTYFGELLTGRWDRPCNLRKNDHLQELKETINQFMNRVRQQMHGQNDVLAAVRAALADPSLSQDQRQQLISRIDLQMAEYLKRYPAENSPRHPELPGFGGGEDQIKLASVLESTL